MLRMLFARHGESEWQVVGEDAGPDSALTDLGRRQADQLGRWVAEHLSVDHIYTSPLQRARDTAEAVARHLDQPLENLEGLQESWFLVAPKLPKYEQPADVLDRNSSTPANRDYATFRAQVAGAMQHILGRHDDGTVLVVAHGGTIGTALRLLLGSDAFTVNVGNTTLHSLTWNDERWHIEYIDRWDHLRNL